jgi:hypothetical protein
MTKKKNRIVRPALLITVTVLTVLTYAASAKLRGSKTADAKTQNVANPLNVKRAAYVRRSSLSPKLVWHLKAVGDRLEKPGNERLTLTGTLTRTNDPQTQKVVAVLEFPDRLRLTIQKGAQTRVILFDGEPARSAANSLDTAEQDLIETLVYGTAEHFFATQMQGMATRFLGSRFRMGDGSSADDSGPYYDVYKVADRVKTSTEQREQLKLYYFNSETLLLERVSYEINRNGSIVNVEEHIGGWTKEQDQQVARRIERYENGESVFVLTVHTSGLSARADDGIFAN